MSLNNILPANNNRVNDAAAITLNGGLINFLPGVLSATNETFGNVTVRRIWSNLGERSFRAALREP